MKWTVLYISLSHTHTPQVWAHINKQNYLHTLKDDLLEDFQKIFW